MTEMGIIHKKLSSAIFPKYAAGSKWFKSIKMFFEQLILLIFVMN